MAEFPRVEYPQDRYHPRQLRERFAGQLLAELRAAAGELAWYYISVALPGGGFYGGYLIQARGRLEAWNLLHALNGVPPDHETLTTGPVPEDVLEKIPEEMRWRRLNQEEARALGK